MMYLKHLVTAATAASLPSASAIYDPDVDLVPVGAEPGAATFALALPEAAAAPVPTGASYCTWSPEYACYASGWPRCCEDGGGAACPGARPGCEAAPTALAATSEGDASDGAAAVTSTAPADVAAPLAAAPLAAAPLAAAPLAAAPLAAAPLVVAPPPTGAGVAITTATALPPDPLLVGPTWTAVRYRSADAGGLVGVAEGSVVTFEIEEDGSFDGHAGCNNYFGKFEPGSFGPAAVAASALRSAVSPTTSTFVIDGRVGSTRMMCEGIMAQEVAYLANFNGAVTFSVQSGGEEMKMTDEAGNVIAEYALYTPPILGRTWTATRYHSAEEDDLVDVLPGSVITLEMRVDEKLGGRAGCNRYDAAYDDLTTESFALAGALVVTKRACDRPADVMEQESAYLKNFEGGRRRWAILDDGSLELRDVESGAVVALYHEGADKGVDADAAFATVSASGGAALPTASAAVAMVAGLLVLHMS